MRFSLILATLGRTHELARFLTTLDAQTYRDFELIVIDQNPDDRLVPVLEPYRARFSVSYLRTAPGLSRARNLGLQHIQGDIIAFPDDDCWYASDLLKNMVRFFADHPEWDGLIGRSTDEEGRPGGTARFASTAGVVKKLNVLRRGGTTITCFFRSQVLDGVLFDEELGPGAGTPWGCGEDTDYVLTLLSRHAQLYYDPAYVVCHAYPLVQYDAKVLYKAYTYGAGMERVLCKHDFPWWFILRSLIRPFGGTLLSLGHLRFPEARYRWRVFRGRLQGVLLNRLTIGRRDESMSAQYLP